MFTLHNHFHWKLISKKGNEIFGALSTYINAKQRGKSLKWRECSRCYSELCLTQIQSLLVSLKCSCLRSPWHLLTAEREWSNDICSNVIAKSLKYFYPAVLLILVLSSKRSASSLVETRQPINMCGYLPPCMHPVQHLAAQLWGLAL